MKKDIMGLLFDNITLDGAVSAALSHIENKTKCMVVTPNAEIAYMASKNSEIKDIINNAQLVLPDGVGVILASKIIKNPLSGKVAGVDFAHKLIAATDRPVFLLGGKPGVADVAAENIVSMFNSANIVGTMDGYFKDESEAIRRINDSGAEILYVCLGAPKQEQFIVRNMDVLAPYVMAGLGGSLDVLAGTAVRAPDIFIKLGLEWFYRLLKDPKRIKRMSVLPLYALKAVFYKDKGEKNA